MSKGEKEVAKMLTNLNLPFKQEVHLTGLTNEIGTSLPVDFVVNVAGKLAMIEFNGAQHYQPVMDQIQEFNCRIRNDNARISFANKTGIPLLVIHHKDLDKLSLVIKPFINQVKNNCKKKQKYASKSYGYFEAAINQTAPKITDVFAATHTLEVPVTHIKSGELSQLSHNEQYGFVQIGTGDTSAIIWTISQMNQFINQLKQEKSQIEAIKVENQRLMMKISLSNALMLEMGQENTQLKIENDGLKEENERLLTEILQIKQPDAKKEIPSCGVVLKKGKHIQPELPFPSVVRKANRTFTTEFITYVNAIKKDFDLTKEELQEYLAHFDVVISHVTLKKWVA